MGIRGLFALINSTGKSCSLEDLKGKVAAIDASCWLHKGLNVSPTHPDQQIKCTTAHLWRYVRLLERHDIRPLLVFDGKELPLKYEENERRNREREKKNTDANNLERRGDKAGAEKLRKQASSITWSLVSNVIMKCRENNILYIMAPYEADSELVHLVNIGLADFAISEDSDLMAYGCKMVLYKLTLNGRGHLFALQDVLAFLKLSHEEFQIMCILCGCDYLPSPPRVGPYTARSLVQEASRKKIKIMDHLQSSGSLLKDNNEYMGKLQQTLDVFKHQIVLNPLSMKLVYLHVYNSDSDQHMSRMSTLMFSDFLACHIAVGNIDTKTGHMENNYQIPINPPLLCLDEDQSRTMTRANDYNEFSKTSFDAMVISIDNNLVKWKIPSFDIMEIEFKKVNAEINSTNTVLFINAEDNTTAGEKISITEHFKIQIGTENKIVAWKFEKVDIAIDNQYGHIHANQIDVDNDNNDLDDTVTDLQTNAGTFRHTAAFKVLGTCYNKNYQRHTEKAFDLMKTFGSHHIQVKLVPEPQNTFDSKAIAVTLQYDNTGYHRVGYIPRELTKFIHEFFATHDILECHLRSINFRTTFMLIGFYLSIYIASKKEWPKDVIKASKKVR